MTLTLLNCFEAKWQDLMINDRLPEKLQIKTEKGERIKKDERTRTGHECQENLVRRGIFIEILNTYDWSAPE
jgi:hypothetical protein